MKRIIAFLLICAMALAALPAGTAHAAGGAKLQPPVTNMSMTVLNNGATGSTYEYRIDWSQPSEGADDLAAVDGIGYPTEYIINYRNATTGRLDTSAVFLDSQMDVLDSYKIDDKNPYQITTKTFQPSSLYEFKITPMHNNEYTVPNPPPTTEFRPAPPDTSSRFVEMRAILMTDIEVEASGEGSELNVYWKNPTWGGTSLFDGYRILYQLSIDGQPIGAEKYRDILLADTTQDDRGFRHYTLYDSGLSSGQLYDVKVEPMINGKLVRLAAGATQAQKDEVNFFRLNGISYYLFYRGLNAEYKTGDPAIIMPSLRATPESSDFIRLEWGSLSKYSGGSVKGIELVRLNPETLQVISTIVKIDGDNARDIGHWLTEMPDALSAYQLIIHLTSGGQDKTKVVFYDPRYNDFIPYKPDILEIYASAGSSNSIQLKWLAFSRSPYTPLESGMTDDTYPGDPYIDRDIVYDMYVAESWDLLEDAVPVLERVMPSQLVLEPWYPPNDNVNPRPSYAPASPVTQYSKYNESTGIYELKPLEENKVYYVKIIATRNPTGQISQPAYASVFITAGNIIVDPNMIAAPPLKVIESGVTDTVIPIMWDEKYIEMYDSAADRWYAVAGVDENGQLVFGKPAQNMKNSGTNTFILNDLIDKSVLEELSLGQPDALNAFLTGTARSRVIAALNGLGLDPPLSENDVILRMIDLTQASYEVHVVEYDYMIEQGGYEQYYAARLENNDGAWTPVPSITPGGPCELTSVITAANAPAGGPLLPNTSYVIYLRPYIDVITPDGTVRRIAYYPNYVMATTNEEHRQLDADPTTPVLRAVDKTDTTITVEWRVEDFDYEIRVSDRLLDYDEGGTLITWDDIKPPAAEIITDANGRAYYRYTIHGLFPDTLYYIWAHAIANNSTGTKISKWSNAVEMKTYDIRKPDPPRGLGLAANDHMRIYNDLNNTDYAPEEENALTITWMIDDDDEAEASASGTAEGGSAAALTLREAVEIGMYLVRFDGLVANRSYYIRAKTVYTVTRTGAPGGTGGVDKQYNYIVQVSPDTEFKDYIEFTVPTMTPTASLDQHTNKRKESDWSAVIRLYTARSTGEYDGDVDPDHYPLPEQDWEIIYDRATGRLMFRFRSNQKDASGANDNLVDQRFISRLIADRTFTYNIDLTRYGTSRVTSRVVEIPYSIIKAFDERKITLELTADNMTLSVPPGSLDTAAVRALPDMGVGSWVRFTVTEAPAGTPALTAGESYISKPQRLNATVYTPSRTVNLDAFAKPVGVKMALNSRSLPMDKSVEMYYSTPDTGGWSRVSGQYAPLTGTLNASMYQPGTFAGIAKDTPSAAVNPGDVTRDALYSVTSRLNITDIGRYNANSSVLPVQFNNIVAALANGRAQTAMNAALPAADRQALERAKMYIPDAAYATREAAISALVTLYEVKTGRVIKPSATVAAYPNIASATAAYRANLLKAVDAGLLTSQEGLIAPMTMGEFMQLLDIIIQDAGL